MVKVGRNYTVPQIREIRWDWKDVAPFRFDSEAWLVVEVEVLELEGLPSTLLVGLPDLGKKTRILFRVNFLAVLPAFLDKLTDQSPTSTFL